jgi:hypothetical protein
MARLPQQPCLVLRLMGFSAGGGRTRSPAWLFVHYGIREGLHALATAKEGSTQAAGGTIGGALTE